MRSERNISIKYRSCHPSYLGKLDLNTCSASSPGLNGCISPFAKTDRLWFDGDIERIRYVLGDNGKQRPDTIFYLETPFRENLFKGEIPDSFDTGRCIYQINEDAFFNPKSYIDIYE